MSAIPIRSRLWEIGSALLKFLFPVFEYMQLVGPCLRNCLFGIADPGVHRVGRSIAFFFFTKKMEVSASNLFEMQAILYAELTDDIFRNYSVPKNSLLKHKTSRVRAAI